MLRLMIWFGVHGKRHMVRERRLLAGLKVMGIGND